MHLEICVTDLFYRYFQMRHIRMLGTGSSSNAYILGSIGLTL